MSGPRRIRSTVETVNKIPMSNTSTGILWFSWLLNVLCPNLWTFVYLFLQGPCAGTWGLSSRRSGYSKDETLEDSVELVTIEDGWFHKGWIGVCVSQFKCPQSWTQFCGDSVFFELLVQLHIMWVGPQGNTNGWIEVALGCGGAAGVTWISVQKISLEEANK